MTDRKYMVVVAYDTDYYPQVDTWLDVEPHRAAELAENWLKDKDCHHIMIIRQEQESEDQ